MLGQPNFTTKSLDLLATKMYEPSGISLSSDDTLWVADRYYARVTRFDNASTKGTGAAADGVLGQPDFFSDKQNNNTQGEYSANSQGFLFPAHVFVDNLKGGVWVSDTQNNRVLRFSVINTPPTDTTKPVLAVAKTPKFTKANKITIRGTATDKGGRVARVQYRVGSGAAKNATGAVKWQFSIPLKKGKNAITINAVDAAGNVSAKQVVKIQRK